MATSASLHPTDTETIIATAREVIEAESRAVMGLLSQVEGGFIDLVRQTLQLRGRVVVSGMGKSGLVAQKISATLASTGTPSLFLHAAEAVHGDLGRIKPSDLVLCLSNSGESSEILRLIRPVKGIGATFVALTGDTESSLAKHADIVVSIGAVAEACPMGLVPTASTTAMMVVGDALAMCLFELRGLGKEEYARFHPGGSLGRKLMRIEEVMRQGDENPVVPGTASIREAVVVMTQTQGRPGCASVVDDGGLLAGFFTDGDLRRLLAEPNFDIDRPISAVMHTDCKSVSPERLVVEAAKVMRENQIDQVPVVDDGGKPVGLLDVQDLLVTRII